LKRPGSGHLSEGPSPAVSSYICETSRRARRFSRTNRAREAGDPADPGRARETPPGG